MYSLNIFYSKGWGRRSFEDSKRACIVMKEKRRPSKLYVMHGSTIISNALTFISNALTADLLMYIIMSKVSIYGQPYIYDDQVTSYNQF